MVYSLLLLYLRRLVIAIVSIRSIEEIINPDSSQEELTDILKDSCTVSPRGFSFYLPHNIRQTIIEVYQDENFDLQPSTIHAVVLPFVPSAEVPPDPGFPFCISIEGVGNHSEFLLLKWQPYKVVFEVYSSDLNEEDTTRCRLTLIPHKQPEASVLRYDPAFSVPSKPLAKEPTPPISVQFGSQPQALFSKVVRLHDKLNLFNAGTVGNHRYWRPDHHQQGFAWSPGTVTLKLRASFDHSLLEVYSAPQVTVQAKSARALAMPFTVIPLGTVELQVPQGAIETFVLPPGNYTLLFAMHCAQVRRSVTGSGF